MVSNWVEFNIREKTISNQTVVCGQNFRNTQKTLKNNRKVFYLVYAFSKVLMQFKEALVLKIVP